MTQDALINLFREKLRVCNRRKKYHRTFTPQDEERAIQAFTLVLGHSTLSEDLIFEQLTGEKRP